MTYEPPLAIAKGFMPPRKVVPKGAALSEDQRRSLALGADAWAQYWDELWERQRGRVVVDWALNKHDDWGAREMARRNLQAQDAARVELGWNNELADAAAQFHQKSEERMMGGKWEKRAFIFYSVAKEPTTMAVEARQILSKNYHRDVVQLMNDLGMPIRELWADDVLPPPCESGKPEMKSKLPGKSYGLVEEGVRIAEYWSVQGGELHRERWRFATLRQMEGDGTVPLGSLVGFGGPAQVFKKLVLDEKDEKAVVGPNHIDAPDHRWAWARIIDVLQSYDVDKYLDHNVDTTVGDDPDNRVRKLCEDYYNA